jgi:hypothetical protein
MSRIFNLHGEDNGTQAFYFKQNPGAFERLKRALDQWHEAHRQQFIREGLINSLPTFDTQEEKHAHIGDRYIRLDVGGSGAFMLDAETGIIYGIKGYGKVDKKKIAGNINDPCFDGAILFRDRFRHGRFDNRTAEVAKYKVHCGGRRWVYFATLEAANRFCNEVIRKTGDVLAVLAVQS